MSTDRPKDIAEYCRWLSDELNVEISKRTQTRYEIVSSYIRSALDDSDVWSEFCSNLAEYDSQYRRKTSYPLLASSEPPKLVTKPFQSVLEKTFRKNALENDAWPDEPEFGWILPNNWYSKISDIVRTTVVVKYLDGVDFLGDKIKSLCSQHGLPCRLELEAREEGYYAAHIRTEREFEVPGADWDTERIRVPVEIQITTQLQEVIRRLLHKYYEEQRLATLQEDPAKWQWDYRSDEFIAGYLGHILHYVEGMIMEVIARQREEHHDGMV
jgi:ppGpp synthetase/RelA/SpoT-type nucleotidyltranferase